VFGGTGGCGGEIVKILVKGIDRERDKLREGPED